MKNFLHKILNKSIDIPEPARYPGFNNVKEWMEQNIEYFEKMRPENLHNLFNPSSGDYIPLKIVAGTGDRLLKENLSYYRDIKKRYPEAVARAKSEYLDYMKFPNGDPEDYPTT